jgi:hypothetical protein
MLGLYLVAGSCCHAIKQQEGNRQECTLHTCKNIIPGENLTFSSYYIPLFLPCAGKNKAATGFYLNTE